MLFVSDVQWSGNTTIYLISNPREPETALGTVTMVPLNNGTAFIETRDIDGEPHQVDSSRSRAFRRTVARYLLTAG